MKIVSSLSFITIVSLPLYIIRCRSFAWCASPVPLTLLEVLILLTFSAWVVWIMFRLRKNKDTLNSLAKKLRNPLILPTLALFIFSTISLLSTSDLIGGLGIWKAYFVEGIMIYLVVLDLSIRKNDYLWVLKALLVSGLILSVSTFIDFALLIKELGFDQATNIRITGLFEFANAIPLYLGPIAALSVSIILSMYKNSKNRPLFYLAIVNLIFILGAIFLSQSKGGMVGMFSILVVWLAFLVHRSLSVNYRKLFKYAAYTSIGVYLLINLLVFVNIDNLAPKERSSGNSLVNRYCIWQGTRDLLKDKPIAGSGLNGYQLDYKDYKTCLGADYQYPHNIFLTFWTELGVLGGLAFIWLTYVYLKTNSKGNDKILSVGLLAALVYIFVHGLVDVPYFKNDLSAEFWILAALVSINYKFRPNS